MGYYPIGVVVKVVLPLNALQGLCSAPSYLWHECGSLLCGIKKITNIYLNALKIFDPLKPL